MTADNKKREQGRKRAQKLRENRKASGITTFPLPLEKVELERLDEICQFFSHPNPPCGHAEGLQMLIHRVHNEISGIREKLGNCQYCGECLPEGCGKLREGGLFKGDARCWHTLNRIRIHDITQRAS
ncbi:hypothetical protein P0Y67_07900 [Photobacterium sp. SP02]|uniref:hypothetical protein n=1 Tax=Photobacterium sp. SP02 TaxID=3032280 RepID=UPI0031453DAC